MAKIKKIKAYKGFNRANEEDGLKNNCRLYEFDLGKMYTVKGPIRACNNGFHACINPRDVLGHYDLDESHIFGEVELSGAMDHREDKVAARNIRVLRWIENDEFKELCSGPTVNEDSAVFYIDTDVLTNTDTGKTPVLINKKKSAYLYENYESSFDGNDLSVVSEAEDAVFFGDFKTVKGKLGCVFIHRSTMKVNKVDGKKIKVDREYRFTPTGTLVLAKAKKKGKKNASSKAA